MDRSWWVKSPFGDGLLDFEFEHPNTIPSVAALSSDETSYLESTTLAALVSEARHTLPSRIDLLESIEIARNWLRGNTEAVSLSGADDSVQGTPRDEIVTVFREPMARQYVHYLIGLHRHGFVVYSDTPVYRACNQHVFSLWPGHLFEQMDSSYRKLTRELVGPGIGFQLPPLTTVLLTRSRKRYLIPRELVELRQEFGKAREELWSLLIDMWTSPTLAGQVRILKKLDRAAESLFCAAFPERFDALRLGIGVVGALTGNVSESLTDLRSRDRPNANVSAVSFAKGLAQQIRQFTANSDCLLKRHLTPSELAGFGV